MIIRLEDYMNNDIESLEEGFYHTKFKSKNNIFHVLIRDQSFDGDVLAHATSVKFCADNKVGRGNSFSIIIPKPQEEDQTIKLAPKMVISDKNEKCVDSAINFCKFHRQALLDFDMFDCGDAIMCKEQKDITEAIEYNCNIYVKGLNEKGETIITDIKVRDFGYNKNAIPLSDEEYYSNFKKLYRTILWKRRVTGNSI